MRQNQQNRRMRGRNNGGGGGGNNNNNNNNNRRGPNPLTRSYESNGPDVKVRGTAQHVAEKYLQLARDAHSSGDRVMAENYLQHAEHYNRIIAAAMAQQQAQREQRDVEEDEDLTDNSDNRFADNPITVRQREQQEQQDQQNVPSNNQPQVNVYDGDQPQPIVEAMAPVDGGLQPVVRDNNRTPREPRPPREGGDGERNGPRNTRRERGPRVPREPRVEAVAETSDAPEEGGLLATLSRGADKPVPVTADE